MNELANQFTSAVSNIVDSKLSASSAPSSLSPVAIDVSNPPCSIAEAVVDASSGTVYLLLDAPEEVLVQDLSTPIKISCQVILDGEPHDFTISGTFAAFEISNYKDLFSVHAGSYTDNDVKYRAIVLMWSHPEHGLPIITGASGEFVWDSLPIQALETTIDENMYQIPLLSRLTVLEQAFAESNQRLDRSFNSVLTLEERVSEFERDVIGFLEQNNISITQLTQRVVELEARVANLEKA